MKRNITKLTLAALLAVTSTSACFAQTYPTKTIRLIVPSAPGGPVDVRGRWIADRVNIRARDVRRRIIPPETFNRPARRVSHGDRML